MWDTCLRKAKRIAWKWSYDRKVAFLRTHEWGNQSHWDNWFDPRSGWNFSLLNAVEHELTEQEYSSL